VSSALSVFEVPVAAVASIEREPDAAAEADDSGDGSVPVRLGLAPDAPIVVRQRLTAAGRR